MTLYLHPDDSLLFGRPSVDRSDPDTDLNDFSGGPGPHKLLLSLTSQCNLRCAHCPRGTFPQLFPDGPPQEISREILDSIIDQLFPRMRAVLIGGYDYGEQILSPHFTYVLERACEYPNLTLELLTNGSQLATIPGELLAKAVSRIHVSLEGYGEGYAAVRGIPWTTLERNLDYALEARAKWPREPRMLISFALCVMRPNLADYFALVDYAQQAGIDLIEARDFYPSGYTDMNASLLYHEKERAQFYQDLAAYAASHQVPFSPPPEIPVDPSQRKTFRRAPCTAPFEIIGFHTDGSVFFCPCEKSTFGKLSSPQDSIDDIWRSPALVEYRKRVNGPNPSESCLTCPIVNLNPLVYRQKKTRMFAKYVYSNTPLRHLTVIKRFGKAIWRVQRSVSK